MTLGFSRDDSVKFLEAYKKKEIFDKDPFERLDQEGVGLLMKCAVDKGRSARPVIKMGICGGARRRTELHRLLPQNRA